jgi:type I restriction enzyme R subunit
VSCFADTVLECKRPGKVGGEDPVDQAVSQQLRSQRENEIPRLFHFAQVLFTLAVNQAKYGATGTSLSFWQLWREQVLSESGLLELLRPPLTPKEREKTFSSDLHRFNGATRR